VVVEDAPAGVRSGKAAGTRVIALRTTMTEKELWDAGADWVVGDCAAIALATPAIQDGNLSLVLKEN
jgi:glycerol 3-phosphatase-1